MSTTTTTGLSPAEQRLEWHIRAYIAEHGYSPTLRELCESLGYKSPNSGAIIINGLIRKGRLTRGHGARTVMPVDQPERTKLLAALGSLPIGILRRLVTTECGPAVASAPRLSFDQPGR